jgi:cbb3-type cytochrome oxidase subunit 1
MPRLSQYFVRSALLYLLLGFSIGGLILASKATPAVSGIVWLWLPAHISLLLAGWLIQLALGVAYWILPRVAYTRRGRERLAWIAFAALQVGLLLVVFSMLQIWWPPAREVLPLGVGLQALSVTLFGVHAWPRARSAFAAPKP